MVTEYFGACDASAAEAVGGNLFVAGNDEDNVLRVYSRDAGGKPIATFDLTTFLNTDPERPEADLEAATQLGGRIYWITSHGRNKEGKPRPSRRRFFATDIKPTDGGGVSFTPIGTPYTKLVDDLVAAPAFKPFDLDAAERRAPEAKNGLNIEGLAATPDGTLLIAFRNPIPDRKALIVPLTNPAQLLTTGPAEFGAPITLDLGKRGIRSLVYFAPQKQYLIVAGAPDDASKFAMFRWAGPGSGQVEQIPEIDFKGINPEALVTYPDKLAKVQLLSDDGGRKVWGGDCKKAPPEKRSFRGVWITM
jgi:hypothetical protein